MTLFNNICRQHDDAIEKQLATRQLNIKTTESKSWFTILKKTLIKYDFSNTNIASIGSKPDMMYIAGSAALVSV
jgi:hypothetical protein